MKPLPPFFFVPLFSHASLVHYSLGEIHRLSAFELLMGGTLQSPQFGTTITASTAMANNTAVHCRDVGSG